MAALSDMRDRFSVGALIFAKATLVLKTCELGRHYGSRSDKMWIPGKVMLCSVKKSEKGRNIKYVTCVFHIGGDNVKIFEIGIQATKIQPPAGTFIPERITGLNMPVILALLPPLPSIAQREGGEALARTLNDEPSPPSRLLFGATNDAGRMEVGADDDDDSVTIDPRANIRPNLPARVSTSPLTGPPLGTINVGAPRRSASTSTQLSNNGNATLPLPVFETVMHHSPSRPHLPNMTVVQPLSQPERVQPSSSGGRSVPTKQNPVDYHGVEWYKDNSASASFCNGPVPFRTWAFRDIFHNKYTRNSDMQRMDDRLDYFRMMFPPQALKHIVNCTNDELCLVSMAETDAEEILCFFGLIILGTRYEFTDRRSLWANQAITRFQPAPDFSRTGMSRNRFDNLWRCIRFSDQPKQRPSHLTDKDYRWMLVDDFVSYFNEHRARFMTPSSDLCVDESIARWYGLGGDWINVGLPMYVAMERKPEFGCEVQNLCDGETGIMLRLLIVKSASSANRLQGGVAVDDEQLNHGSKVIKFLCGPWAKTGRTVYADSYYASVQTARELFKMGLRFTGVVKTATTGFPTKFLQELQFEEGRGGWEGLFHKGNEEQEADPDMVAFAWVDKNRRYFISTTSSLTKAAPLERTRVRQLVRDCTLPPERMHLSVEQPEASKQYYEYCAKIDQHNRIRQDDLKIERKYGTHDWSKRVNLAIFGMIAVDAYLMHKHCTGISESPHEFFSRLSEELIDYGRINRARRKVLQDAEADYAAEVAGRAVARDDCPSGIGIRLTPNKKKRGSPNSSSEEAQQLKDHREQRRCGICKRKTTWVCSECLLAKSERHSFCHTRNRAHCWETHLHQQHNVCMASKKAHK